MSTLNFIAKLVAVLAVLAGLVLVVVIYGDKIKAYCKKQARRRTFRSCMNDDDDFCDDDDFDADEILADVEDFAD